MYLNTLQLRNIRCFDDILFTFINADSSPRMWTAITGENGTGKSTVLQAIAMASTGGLLLSAVAGSAFNSWHNSRLRYSEAIVNAGFEFGEYSSDIGQHPHWIQESENFLSNRPLISTVTLYYGGGVPFTASYYHKQRISDLLDTARASQNLPGWFVAGYMSSRHLSRSFCLYQPRVQRFQSLFNSEAELIGTNFPQLFGPKTEKAHCFCNILQEILISSDLLPEKVIKSEFKRNDYNRIPLFTTFSDGIRSTIAWIADLLGHLLLERKESEISPPKLEGLVLVDGIDLYLSPPKTIGLISSLREIFPKLQFIVSIYNPSILSTFNSEEIIYLKGI